MKLPLSRPSTNSSPSGYALVISAPRAFTFAAMVASSYTIDLTVRPPVRRRAAPEVGIVRQGGGQRSGNGLRRAAHSRDPDDGSGQLDDGPCRTLRPRDPGAL